MDVWIVREVALESLRVPRLPHEVEFVAKCPGKLIHEWFDIDAKKRIQPETRGNAPGETRRDIQIELHLSTHAGALHLDHRVDATVQRNGMDLSDRCRREWHRIERLEDFAQRK